jgi:hypothetical protein
MADVDVERARTRHDGRRTDEGTSMRAKIVTSTEARWSLLTTEFWLSLAMAVALIVAGYADDDGLATDQGWALAAGVIALYSISRGLAKAGSRDPEIRDLD